MSLLPIISLPALFHIGQMNPSLKGSTHNKTSLEGNGLSVSLDPDAWRTIAKLGGNPVWELACKGECNFVDRHAMESMHWAVIEKWALDQGLIESTEVIEVSWYDDEMEGRCAMQFDASKPTQVESAKSEFEHRVEWESDSEPKLERIPAWKATFKMNERMGFAVSVDQTMDMALTFFVEDHFSKMGLNGVWWNDDFDVHNYSAPRGVIHRMALRQWGAEVVESPIVRDRPCC